MAGVVGCALIFGSTLATNALWRSAASLDGGVVRSGSITLLNGDASGQVRSYAFDALTGTALRPGSVVQAPLVMRNGGTSAFDYRLALATATGTSSLPAQLSLRLDVVNGSCPAGIGAGPPAGIIATVYDGELSGASTTAARRLAPDATETLCVRVGVKAGAPQSSSGASTTVTFTFRAQAS